MAATKCRPTLYTVEMDVLDGKRHVSIMLGVANSIHERQRVYNLFRKFEGYRCWEHKIELKTEFLDEDQSG